MDREPKLASGTPPLLWAAAGGLIRRSFLVAGSAAAAATLSSRAVFAAQDYSDFRSVPTQYIAALTSPDARSGNDAQTWGLWRQDPGPRGVQLRDYERLKAAGGVAPSQWTFDDRAWWLRRSSDIFDAP